MDISLPQFIAELGDQVFAERVGVPIRTAQSWRRRERLPRPELARQIVDLAAGRVTFDGIYGEPANDDAPPAEGDGAGGEGA